LLAVAATALAAGAAQVGGAKPTAKVTKVTVTEKEFKLTLSKASFKPGAYSFVVVNKGTVTHSLVISGPGLKGAKLKASLQPGRSSTLNVTLKDGKYTIWCPIDGHASSGMKVSLTVTAVGGTATPAPTSTTGGGGDEGGYGGYGGGYSG
jgi:uncharacterized cupredoxin-like copper-binding protein